MPVVSLLTDFGLQDPFVGEMKAVLCRLAPQAVCVDLTHGVRAGAVREAAWLLGKSWDRFPDGTVHLVVVDPGVGSDRRGLVVAAAGHWFVGPDNGVLTAALDRPGAAAFEIAARDPDAVRRGTTFDGRDLFAPSAAAILGGARADEFGPGVTDAVREPAFVPTEGPGGWSVEVVRVDRFGNLVTACEERFLRESLGDAWRRARVRAGGARLEGVRLAYAEVEPGEPLLSVGGSGTLEISVRDGRAAEVLGLGAGDRVFLEGFQ